MIGREGMTMLHSMARAATETAGIRITELPPAATLAGSALFEIAQDGVSLAATAAQIAGAARSVVNVADFGVVADGSIEAGPSIQAAIASIAATGGEVFIPRGRYRLQAGPLVLPGNVVLVGEGRATVIETLSVAADFSMVMATGTMAAGQMLTANATENSRTLTVAGLAGVAAGDWLHVNSTLTVGSTFQKQGEIVRVSAVAGDTITLYDPLCDSYATANAAQLQKITPVSGAGVRNVSFLGPASTTWRTTGIRAELCHDLSVWGCSFVNTQYAGIALYNTWGSRVGDCYFRDITKPTLAYGIALAFACQDVLMTNLIGERMRHLVTHGGGTSLSGVPRRCSTVGATATNMMEAGFDCHPAGEDILFSDCHVLGSLVDGFMFQGTSGMVANCTARNVGRHGFAIQPSTLRPFDYTLNNARAQNCGSKGICVTTSALYGLGRSLRIKNATVSGCVNGVYVNDTEETQVAGLDIDGVHSDTCSSYDVVVSRVVGFNIRGLNLRASVRGLLLSRSSQGVVGGSNIDGLGTATHAIQCVAVTNTEFSAINGRNCSIGIALDADCNTTMIDASADFRGCTTPRSLGSGANNLYGIRSDDPRIIAVSVSAGYIEQRRTSDCFTLPVTSGGTPLGAVASGSVLAALAYSLVNGTFTRIAWSSSTGTAPALTDFRLGVWDPAIAGYLAQTDNEAANVLANTLHTFSLLAPVSLIAGQPVLLTVGGVGATMPIFRGSAMGSAQSVRLTLAGYKNCTLAAGWTGGPLLAPGTGSTGLIPWLELMP